METHNISITALTLGSLIMLVPAAILVYYKTGIVTGTIIAFVRMTLQLTLVGIYLKYIFDLNSIYVNILWLFIMIVAADLSIVRQSGLKNKAFFLPLLLSLAAQLIINGAIIAIVVIGDDFFNARYLIPISGMLLGNCLTSAIIGLKFFYNSLRNDESFYKYSLMCGATKNEALFPFIGEAMKAAFGPVIANTSSIGLIWLPGMMTGQLLGGSSPLISIKYQIMIIIAIFVGSVLTVFLSIYFSKKFAFDSMDLPDKSIYRNSYQQ